MRKRIIGGLLILLGIVLVEAMGWMLLHPAPESNGTVVFFQINQVIGLAAGIASIGIGACVFTEA